MKDISKYYHLNNIYILIKNKNYIEAEILLNEIDQEEYYSYGFEIRFLYKFLNECKYFESLRGTPYNYTLRTFLKGGKDSSYFNEPYYEYNYYTAGLYVTNEPIFYYLTGKFLFNNDETKEEAVSYLEKYIELGGSSKLYKAYEYLAKYYNSINLTKSKKFYKRYNRLCLLMNVNNVLYDENSKTYNLYFKKR